jgi:hypothetical protein
MSASVAGHMAGTDTGGRSRSGRLRAYFWSDNVRAVQTVLGLIWALDGGLQFQSFMYTHAFPAGLAAMAAGQPGWLASSLGWGARMLNGNLDVWNTLFALTQCLIGLGLLYRPTVRLALAGSFFWVLFVWWFGEAFGMLFMDMAQPLTGAPGGVLMYGLIGLIVWPNGRPGGLLGVRGAKILWSVLWSVMAYLWLLSASSSANATSGMLTSVDPGMGWLRSLQSSLAGDLRGDGLVIALVLGALTLAIAIGVAAEWAPRTWLWISIVLNLVYWVIPQSFGGIFAGGATDLNAGPLFVLLAAAMFPLVGRGAGRAVRTTATAEVEPAS